MAYTIDDKEWRICKICQKPMKDFAKEYGGTGKYYSQVFEKHILNDHKIELIDYFLQICQLQKPKCKCIDENCTKPCRLFRHSKDFFWTEYSCGKNPGVMEWSKKAKEERKGAGNPMYGKTPWNSGLTKETSESMKRTSEKIIGRKASEEQRRKMSESALKRNVHGHTGHKHSDENKEKFRQNTLKMIKDGKYKQTRSLPHIKLGELLTCLNIRYLEEVVVDIFTFDYYLVDSDYYIEVDGDYFHSNPKIYPDGPKTKTQKVNWYRDIKKNKFVKEKNMNLLRFWECDIINNSEDIKEILCKLKK
jgi:hypothetical protein